MKKDINTSIKKIRFLRSKHKHLTESSNVKNKKGVMFFLISSVSVQWSSQVTLVRDSDRILIDSNKDSLKMFLSQGDSWRILISSPKDIHFTNGEIV